MQHCHLCHCGCESAAPFPLKYAYLGHQKNCGAEFISFQQAVPATPLGSGKRGLGAAPWFQGGLNPMRTMRKGKTKWNNRNKKWKVPPRVYFSTSIESLHSLAKPSCCWALPANCGPQALRSQSLWQGHFLDARAMEPVGELQHGAVQNAFWSCILDKWCGAAVYQETKQSSSRVQLLIDQDFYISGYHWICLIFSGSLEEIGFPRNPPTNPPRNLWRDAAGLASAPEHGPGENTLPGLGPQCRSRRISVDLRVSMVWLINCNSMRAASYLKFLKNDWSK